MTTLYKKAGKRYRPVAEHEEWDSYHEGAHLERSEKWNELKSGAAGCWK